MKRLISSVVIIVVTYMAWAFVTAIESYANQEPKKATVSEHYHFARCPACHLEKRTPSECGHETQAWAWEECVRMENLHSNTESGVQ